MPPSAQFAKVLSDAGRWYVNARRPNQSEMIAVLSFWEITSWKSGKSQKDSLFVSAEKFSLFLWLSDKLIAVAINYRSALGGAGGGHTVRWKKSEKNGARKLGGHQEN